MNYLLDVDLAVLALVFAITARAGTLRRTSNRRNAAARRRRKLRRKEIGKSRRPKTLA